MAEGTSEGHWNPTPGQVQEIPAEKFKMGGVPVKTQSPIGAAHERLEGELTDVAGLLGILEDRLEPIMGPDSDARDVGSSEKRSGEGESPVVQSLIGSAYRAAQLRYRLQAILERIQI